MVRTRRALTLLCGLSTAVVGALGAGLVAPAATTGHADPVRFGRDVRPILAGSCLACHGFDPSTREAGLRLDTFEGATAAPEFGAQPAIVPGDPDASELIARVTSDDPHIRMPEGGEPLTEAQIQTLRTWIEQGGAYERHWSLEPLTDPTPPEVDDAAWSASPIDRFVRAQQASAGLAPAPLADRRTLIRRLSFDLTGLPPTPDEVATFEQDTSEHAYERVVDRLLASPQFGERWARHWLDLMRYAETYAHEFDYPIRHAWQYRDYVIRAFNDDVPYDAFVTEHIAGDLMPEARRHPTEGYNESIIGTGFWWLSQGTHAPVDVRLDEAERIDNQLDVFSKAFLATTVSCARCHDHKFDPIPTSEYYGLSGFLQSSRRQEAYLDPGGRIASTLAELRRIQKTIKPVEAERDDLSTQITESLLASARLLAGEEAADADATRWAEAFRQHQGESARDPVRVWRLLAKATGTTPSQRIAPTEPPAERAGTPLDTFTPGERPDGWFISGWAFGPRPTGAGTVAPRAGVTWVTERTSLDSGSLGDTPMGTLRSPTFEITEPTLAALVRGRGTLRVIIDGYTMDEYNALLFGGMKQGVDTTTWRWHTHDLSRYIGHRAHYEIIDDRRDGAISIAALQWGEQDADAGFGLGITTAMTFEEAAVQLGEQIATAITGDSTGGAPAQLANWLIGQGLLDVPSARERFTQAADTLPDPMRVTASEDGTAEEERVFIRGNHTSLGDSAPRQFLSALTDDPTLPAHHGSGRLLLAQKLLEPDNPMPARVLVNRVWKHLLGDGLVATPDDFGLLGREPTHPELLDWLATRFRTDMGWRIKPLVREIVLSRTYRAAGGVLSERALQVDPTNALRSIRTPKQLGGEVVRDAILRVSGRLDPTSYGPSVPVHLTDFMTGRGRPGASGPLDGNGRRSIYLEVRRNFLTPMMQAFDTPIPHSTMGARNESNVPAQSLMLLNDPFVVQQAGVLAARVLDEADTTDARLDRLYRLALAREPNATERQAMTAFLDRQAQLLAETSDEPDLIALWTDLCHVMFNLKEFRYLE